MDWVSVALAVLTSGVLASLVLSGHAWLKAHAAQTATTVDDKALAAFDFATSLAAHNATLSTLVANSANKFDDAGLALLQKIADSNEAMVAQQKPTA